MTVTYYPPKYESYAEIERAFPGHGGQHALDELQRYARAYGERLATQLCYEHCAKVILEKSHDTRSLEQEAWKDLLAVLSRHSSATVSTRLYWLQTHAGYAYKRTRSPQKRGVYAWAKQWCKAVYPQNVGLCQYCGYDRVYGTGLCCNCGKQFSADR